MFIMSGLSPEHFARELLHNLHIMQIPTPVKDICDKLGIELIFSPELDAEAFYCKFDDKTLIVIKDGADAYATRQSFSISHELGHLSLPGHANEYKCSIEDMNTYSPNKLFEREANQFASELLMPAAFFNDDVNRTSTSIATIIRLSEKYETSLTATALRYVKQTRDCAALICVKNGIIDWVVKSPSFRFDLRNGKVHENTYAYDFFSKGISLIGNSHVVRYDSWLSSTVFDRSLEFTEETISMPSLNQTISILRVNKNDEDYEDIDDW